MHIGIIFLCALLTAPTGWRQESFDFPLAFAPSIPYEGMEHVRFSPYWQDFASERGFSYVFAWDVKRRPSLEAAEFERALNVYFDGLMEQVTRARKIEDPGTVSQANLHPMAAPTGWAAGYGGRVYTWNGFAKGESLVLHVEITHRDCGTDRSQVFFALSRAPRTHAVWNELRAVRESATCP
jgi:hypothetical protein